MAPGPSVRVKSVTWPETVQPRLPARVSTTVTGLRLPAVVSSVSVGSSCGSGRRTGAPSTLITSEPAGRVVVRVSDPGPGGGLAPHWTGPCWSHGGGNGAVAASRSLPPESKVGLPQPLRVRLVGSAPGTWRNWSRPVWTTLTGSGAEPRTVADCG